MILLASTSGLAVGPAKPCPTLESATEKPKRRQALCLLHLQGPCYLEEISPTNMIARSPQPAVASHVLGGGEI